MNRGLMIFVGVAAFFIVFAILVFLIADMVFNRRAEKEIKGILGTVTLNQEKVWHADLKNVPLPVQKWIENSGMLEKEKIKSVRLKQRGEMRTKPDGFWMDTDAVEYFAVENPALLWQAKIRVAPLFSIAERDIYQHGKGNILIKVLSLFTVANSSGKEMDQGSLLRFLAKTPWFPSAVLSPYVKWEPIDAYSAKAHMSFGDITAYGIFRFNKNYDVINFEAERFMERGGNYSKEIWSVDYREHDSLNKIRIPVKGSVSWKFKTDDFTWYNWEITEIEYNKPEMY